MPKHRPRYMSVIGLLLVIYTYGLCMEHTRSALQEDTRPALPASSITTSSVWFFAASITCVNALFAEKLSLSHMAQKAGEIVSSVAEYMKPGVKKS